jgi:hypothetical protein
VLNVSIRTLRERSVRLRAKRFGETTPEPEGRRRETGARRPQRACERRTGREREVSAHTSMRRTFPGRGGGAPRH